jgi:hypothetical protein
VTPRDRLATFDLAVGFVMIIVAILALFLAIGGVEWVVGVIL